MLTVNNLSFCWAETEISLVSTLRSHLARVTCPNVSQIRFKQSCNEDLSRFVGALCEESIIGQKSVSTVHYTRPGTCINYPLIEYSLIFLILLFTKPNIEVSGWLYQTKTHFTHIVYQPFSRVSPPSFTLYGYNLLLFKWTFSTYNTKPNIKHTIPEGSNFEGPWDKGF